MDMTWLDLWKFHGAALLAGCVIDWIIGDPLVASPSGAPYGNHDCRNGIAAQTTERGHGKERPVPAGAILTVSMCIIWWCVPWAAVHWAEQLCLDRAWALLLPAEGFLCSLMLAARGLYTESMKVCRSLEEGRTEEARYNVSMIVGRDTAALDEAESQGSRGDCG